ncbi:MAG: hypothetical protein PF549_03395 [Patescibacteria group bacterium]|jgi:hypothetical protein|nr:hypothetical protein [Patescibacteria group bacterium]
MIEKREKISTLRTTTRINILPEEERKLDCEDCDFKNECPRYLNNQEPILQCKSHRC